MSPMMVVRWAGSKMWVNPSEVLLGLISKKSPVPVYLMFSMAYSPPELPLLYAQAPSVNGKGRGWLSAK